MIGAETLSRFADMELVMKYSLDRIEGDIAVLIGFNDESVLNLPIDRLPENVRDGSTLELADDGTAILLEAESEAALATARSRFDRLKKRNDNAQHSKNM